MKPNLRVNIGRLKLNNPVMVASGTFGYAEEFKDFIDLKKLGAIVTKTITLNPRKGNPPPRTCETPCGMLNSIGLENPGLETFIKEKMAFVKKLGVPLIVSIASEKEPQEFLALARRLDKIKEVSAIELNISCPNIKHGGLKTKGANLISQDPAATYELVKAVRKVTQKTLITKLSPNVADIVEIAEAARRAGTDAVSLINTFYGMSIDIAARRPKLGNIVGGLSGPAIKPLALRMVYEVYRQVKVPIIGMGGIMSALDALEFMIAGATCVSVGTANFVNPKASVEIIRGIKEYLIRNKINDIKGVIGSLKI
jgi:dihydroorotate dehydrogenase (NAD+) catalytic subunit